MSNLSTVIKSIQDVMRQDSGVDGDAQRISQLTWLLFLKVFDAQEEELELTRDAYKSPIPEHLRWRNWAGCRRWLPVGRSKSLNTNWPTRPAAIAFCCKAGIVRRASMTANPRPSPAS